MRHYLRITLVLLGLVLTGLALSYALSRVVGLEELKAERDALRAAIDLHPFVATGAFMLVFAVAAAFMPGAALFKVAAGALFGFWLGLPVALASITAAAAIGFLSARLVGRKRVERRFAAFAARINQGVEREGVVYLLAMRFNPLLPFFLINFGMGLTRMRLWVYAAVTGVGVLPATLIYTNAGTQLASIQQPSDILSARMLVSLVLLSLMPIAGRAAALWLRRRWRLEQQAADG